MGATPKPKPASSREGKPTAPAAIPLVSARTNLPAASPPAAIYLRYTGVGVASKRAWAGAVNPNTQARKISGRLVAASTGRWIIYAHSQKLRVS